MFGDIGAPELLIILAIVIVLFGVGRVGRLGKDLGTAVKDFRKAVKDDDEQPAAPQPPLSLPTPTATPVPPMPGVQAQTPAQPQPAPPSQQPPQSGGPNPPPSVF